MNSTELEFIFKSAIDESTNPDHGHRSRIAEIDLQSIVPYFYQLSIICFEIYLLPSITWKAIHQMIWSLGFIIVMKHYRAKPLVPLHLSLGEGAGNYYID